MLKEEEELVDKFSIHQFMCIFIVHMLEVIFSVHVRMCMVVLRHTFE